VGGTDPTHLRVSTAAPTGRYGMPHFLRDRAISLSRLALLALIAAFLEPAEAVAASSTAYVKHLLVAVNAARASNGLAPLSVESHLQVAAGTHAVQIATTQRLDHSSPDGTPFDVRIERAGFRGHLMGENLAVGFSAAGCVRAWMKSPEHRRNLLSTQFTQIGLGATNGSYQGHRAFWVTVDLGG
jgi:uncharacterized protein YkwD